MKGSKRNIKFNYLFRDGGNYKIFGSIVFSNSKEVDLAVIEKIISSNLIDGQFFCPKRCDIPALSFDEGDDFGFEVWNEYESIELTQENETDRRTIDEFLQCLSEALVS